MFGVTRDRERFSKGVRLRKNREKVSKLERGDGVVLKRPQNGRKGKAVEEAEGRKRETRRWHEWVLATEAEGEGVFAMRDDDAIGTQRTKRGKEARMGQMVLVRIGEGGGERRMDEVDGWGGYVCVGSERESEQPPATGSATLEKGSSPMRENLKPQRQTRGGRRCSGGHWGRVSAWTAWT
jgi:hypothetical protein